MKVNSHGPQATTNLKQRFFLWSAIILLGGGVILSLLSFWNTRRLLMNDAMTKSEVILREVEAIRFYIKQELRPKMFDLHGNDTFIVEAMSTTYISTRIMARFAETMPDYLYRRASLNPHNPDNLADPFEEEMFTWFEEDSNRLFWQGIVKKNGSSYFISMVPDYFSKSCIRCHGKAEEAPQELTKRYGTDGGFRFKNGDLAGINSVAIPVSEAMREAWYGSIYLFIITLGGSVLLLWLLNLLFQRLVIERLGTMLALIGEKKKGKAKLPMGDEIDFLHASLGSLNQYVSSARKGSTLQPNFIGDYIVTDPISAGTMSWIYNGYEQKTKQKVSFKIGYGQLLQNPFYRACFETELFLFKELDHPSIPKVKEHLNDTLIFEQIHGNSLNGVLNPKGIDLRQVKLLFSQLCDLISTLHSAGIVHHDLRPDVFMLSEKDKLLMIDMGLASIDQQEDPIIAAGLGPQGDFLYMAPEVLQGSRGNPCSDIYGLGLLLYIALSGKLPFDEENCSKNKWLRKKEDIATIEKIRENIPDSFAPIVTKAISFDYKERYQWVEDLWGDLNLALRDD